jgi:hypothetical protein
LVRGGVYRELVKPTREGVTVKAAKGEKVVVSGADEIAGRNHQGDKWGAPLAAKPAEVLRDGAAFTDFTYDAAAASIVGSGFDPHPHQTETVMRPAAGDRSAASGVKIEGIDTVDTLGDPVAVKAK